MNPAKSLSRRLIAAAVVLLCFLLLMLFWPFSGSRDAIAPRYSIVTSTPTNAFRWVDYSWDAVNPFPAGKVWIFGAAGGTAHEYLYDLEKQAVVGELLNGGAEFFNHDQSLLLCIGHDSPVPGLKQRCLLLLSKLSGGKIRLPPTNRNETFYVLNMQNNSSRRVGGFSQYNGTGSRWYPSPKQNFGYNVPSTSRQGKELFLVDLDAAKLERINVDGEPHGWWDDHTIFLKDSSDNFTGFDVLTHKTTTYFTHSSLTNTLVNLGFTTNLSEIKSFFNWNGQEYDLFFTARTNWVRDRSFVMKVDKRGPTVKMLYPDFQFEWSSHFDPSATHYLYDGEPGQPGRAGNGGVFLRDLSDNSVRTIIPPDDSKQYALSRFYGRSVIYSHQRHIWRVDLDGTNNFQLFPSPK